MPDHTQLPDSDGAIVTNFQEHPQGVLLTATLEPYFKQRHPQGDYAVGQDSGIYWRWTEPPLKGAVAPDWYYVSGVPTKLAGKPRRSYVLWKERVPPTIVLEFVSGNGSEERDATPSKGKFWIYEQRIGAEYYGIYEVDPGRIEMYRLVNGRYELQPLNPSGRFSIEPMGLELGIWRGTYQALDLPWMRWWYPDGLLIPTGHELAAETRGLAEEEKRRANAEKRRANAEKRRANAEKRRANEESERAKSKVNAPSDSSRSCVPWGSNRRREASRSRDSIGL